MKRLSIIVPSLKGGGIARVMTQLAEALAARRLFSTVDLVILVRRGPRRYTVGSAVDLVELGAPRLAAAVKPLVRYLRQRRPDAILSAGDPANLVTLVSCALARSRARTVLSVHTNVTTHTGNERRSGAPLRLALVPLLIQLLYRRANAVAAVSSGVAADLVSNCKVPERLIRVISNPAVPMNLETLVEEQVEHPWLSPDRTERVVLAAGRLVPQKDFPTLLRALAALRKHLPARLLIIGEGGLRQELLSTAERLGIADAVDLPGFAANPYAWMARADLFVLSSAWEGFGNVLVEAMACGTPVVSTDCPSGPADILMHGNIGPLVPVGDSDALAAAMLATLRRPPSRERLIARAGAFSLEAASSEYYNALAG